MNADEAVETYENGNISDAIKWLRSANKIEVLEFVGALVDRGHSITYAINHTIQLLKRKTS